MKHQNINLILPLFLILMLFGCDDKSSKSIPVSSSGSASTVSTVIKGLSEYKLAVVWKAMPKSYQQDATMAVRSAAALIDKKNYNDIMMLARRIAKVLKDRKELFKTVARKAQPTMPEIKFNSSYDSVVNILNLLVNSDVSDYDSLLKMDIGTFLSETGSDALKTLVESNSETRKKFASITNLNIKVVSIKKDEEDLEISDPQSNRTEKIRFVKIESYWIPQKAVKAWKESIKNHKMVLAEASKNRKRINTLIRGSIPAIEKIVVALEDAKTEKDLETVAAEIKKFKVPEIPREDPQLTK